MATAVRCSSAFVSEREHLAVLSDRNQPSRAGPNAAVRDSSDVVQPPQQRGKYPGGCFLRAARFPLLILFLIFQGWNLPELDQETLQQSTLPTRLYATRR